MRTSLIGFVVLIVLAGCRSTTGPEPVILPEEYLHIRPAWSPDGKTIAFRNLVDPVTRGLYLVDTSGANIRLVHQGEAVGFTWSPDSRWIAFSMLGNLYRIKPNGDSLTKISLTDAAIRPSWSPDGRSIAFVQSTIRVLDVATGSEADMLYTADYPSWDPASREIIVLEAFRNITGFGGTFRFRAIHRSTFAIRTIQSFSSSSDCGFVVMSPRGDEIVYSLKPDAGLTQIWKYIIATQQHTMLADGGADFPSWSPDGQLIVYTRTAPRDGGLWIMFRDGTGKRRLTQPTQRL
jgi:Tol biopolymer transport system component